MLAPTASSSEPVPMDDHPAREEVRAHREERPCQLLDRDVAEDPFEHRGGAPRADERVSGERVVVERCAPARELVRADLQHHLGRPAERRQSGHERSHAASAIAVDDDPLGGERLEDADVRVCPRATSREDDLRASDPVSLRASRLPASARSASAGIT